MSSKWHTVSVPPLAKGEIAEAVVPAEGDGRWGVSEYDTDCHRKVEGCLGLRMLYLFSMYAFLLRHYMVFLLLWQQKI